MEYYLGIDIGTSTAKFTVINEDGIVVNCCEQEYQYSQPKPGWKEIWPKVWVESVKKGMKEILSSNKREYIKAIGFSGQMHTTVFLDKQGNCIRPAIMWNDVRTKEYFPNLKTILTQKDTESIARIISAGSPAANLLWLKDYENENFKKLGKFMIGHDYLVYYFTGQYSTDYCQASTSSLYDTKGREWSKSMGRLIGLSEEMYPPIKGSQEIAGRLRAEIQKEFCLSSEVKVIAGTGDNPATAVSAGCLQEGYPVLSIGTSGVLVLPGEKVRADSKGKEILFSIDGRHLMHLTQGVVQSAGGSYGWYVKKILGINNFNEIITDINISDLGKNRLLFYPHINGDKTIYADSSIRGAFIGLDINDSKEDLAVAVMEGVCFAIKQLIQEMDLSFEKLDQLMVTGGGANSKVWMQMLADILNIRIAQLAYNEGASYGVAVLARNALHQDDSTINNGVKQIKPRNYFEPRTYNVELYLNKYEKYLRIHDAVKMIYQ